MDKLTIIENTITNASEEFVSTLTQNQWDLIPDSQLHAAKQALTKNDYIMGVAAKFPNAVQDALIQCAVLGLDLTEGKNQAWLLPRKNQFKDTVIVLQVGYKGVEAIHQRMGVIKTLTIRVVREKDKFKWSGDDQEKPDHDAKWLNSDKDRGEICGVFSITYYPDKTINVMVVPVSAVFEKHRDRSTSYQTYLKKKSEGGYSHPPPWVTDEQSMVEKTMAFIASKQWPANIQDEVRSSKILETLHSTDTADYSYGFTIKQREVFFELIKKDDALGMYLFTRRVGIEVYSSLTSVLKKSFEKGEKTKKMGVQNTFVATGRKTFENLTESLIINDILLFKESMNGATDIAKKLIGWILSDEQKTAFDNLENEIMEVENE